jgi:integrase
LPRSVTRVVRRGNVFCFRMAVPRHLRVHIGRHEIKLSLRTSDPCTGNVRGRILSNVLDLLFAELSRMQPLSTQTLNERARGYFQQALNRSLEHTFLLPLDPACDLNAEVQSLQDRVRHLRSQLVAQAFSPNVRKEAEALLEPPSGTGDPNSDHYQYACNLILRGKIEEARILAAQLSGDYTAASPLDPLFAGMAATGLPPLAGEEVPPSKQQNQFGQVADQFFEFKVQHDWVKKTAADVKRVLDLAVVLIGSEKPIHLVDVQDVKDVRDALAKLPPNYMKLGANKGMGVKEIISANKSGGGLSLKTQDKYFTMFRQLLIWAANEGLIDKVPGAGVKVAGVGKTNPADQRDSYSTDQLKAIFNSPLYAGHSSKTCRHKPGKVVLRDGKFWVPLIALYSGMRMGEIVQLLVNDLREEGGIWYFDVSKGENKKLKTASSKRRVPVHRIMIEAGFIDFAHSKKANGRIFADIEPGAHGYFSHNLSKWWGRYSGQIGFKTPKTAFHSFRHNFKDRLMAADVQEYITKALMGHADKSVHSQYGSGPGLPALKLAIDKIEYPIEHCF